MSNRRWPLLVAFGMSYFIGGLVYDLGFMDLMALFGPLIVWDVFVNLRAG